jgi:DNA-binding transcriptional MerR regulator
MIQYYRLSEAAAILACSVDSLRRWEAGGVLKYRRICGQRVVTEADLQTIRAHRAKLRRVPKRHALSQVSAAD